MTRVRWHYILILALAILLSIGILVFWPKPSPPRTIPSAGELVIPWEEAKSYVGEIKIVEGPVVDAEFARDSMGSPTFLHIGKPYPDSDRCTVVIWGDHRDKFMRKFPPNPETYLLNEKVRVRGFIDNKGYPEITLTDPANIWVVE
jgi:hypothetical protein